MDILSLCSQAAGNGHASDIFLVPGARAAYKINGEVTPLEGEILTPDDTGALVRQIYALANHRDMERLMDSGDDDFSFSLAGVGRFRCNAFRQRGSLAMVLRIMAFGIPDPGDAAHPPGGAAPGGVPQGHGAGHRRRRQRQIHHPGLHGGPDQPPLPGPYHHHRGPHRVYPPAREQHRHPAGGGA